MRGDHSVMYPNLFLRGVGKLGPRIVPLTTFDSPLH